MLVVTLPPLANYSTVAGSLANVDLKHGLVSTTMTFLRLELLIGCLMIIPVQVLIIPEGNGDGETFGCLKQTKASHQVLELVDLIEVVIAGIVDSSTSTIDEEQNLELADEGKLLNSHIAAVYIDICQEHGYMLGDLGCQSV